MPRRPRFVILPLCVAVACALALGHPQAGVAQPRGEDHVPSKLWKTYPLAPSENAPLRDAEEPERSEPPPSASEPAVSVPAAGRGTASDARDAQPEPPPARGETSAGRTALVLFAVGLVGLVVLLVALPLVGVGLGVVGGPPARVRSAVGAPLRTVARVRPKAAPRRTFPQPANRQSASPYPQASPARRPSLASGARRRTSTAWSSARARAAALATVPRAAARAAHVGGSAVWSTGRLGLVRVGRGVASAAAAASRRFSRRKRMLAPGPTLQNMAPAPAAAGEDDVVANLVRVATAGTVGAPRPGPAEETGRRADDAAARSAADLEALREKARAGRSVADVAGSEVDALKQKRVSSDAGDALKAKARVHGSVAKRAPETETAVLKEKLAPPGRESGVSEAAPTPSPRPTPPLTRAPRPASASRSHFARRPLPSPPAVDRRSRSPLRGFRHVVRAIVSNRDSIALFTLLLVGGAAVGLGVALLLGGV